MVVGIDEQTASLLPEPMTLWHAHLGRLLKALALARPAAVGVDLVLPERSYDFVMPGADRSLLEGILALRGVAPLVLGITVDPNGSPRRIHAPFASVAGPDSTGYVLWRIDPDGLIRRFTEDLDEGGKSVPTLTGTVARRLGVEPGAGLIDFSRGEEFRPVPFHNVLAWLDAGDEKSLREAFSGRPVMIGSVLAFIDRLPVPVELYAGERDRGQTPGVMVHAQALRSALGSGFIREVPAWLLLIAALACALTWFAGARVAPAAAFFALASIALLAGSTALLRAGWHLPVTGLLASIGIALASRLAVVNAVQLRERRQLQRAFAGYVSPPVMDAILDGSADAGLGGRRYRICVMFADVRGFTARSEAMEPEAVIGALNRYFEAVTAAIHEHGGTVDKFMGDGVMAFFGAPNVLPNPCAAAVAAARAMLERLQQLNRKLAAEGAPAVAIGIGLHVGEAVVGHVGSAQRHEYTAIGDVVNVASRIEGLTKELDCALLASREVVQALDKPEGFADLGAQPVRGHAPVDVFGWRG